MRVYTAHSHGCEALQAAGCGKGEFGELAVAVTEAEATGHVPYKV